MKIYIIKFIQSEGDDPEYLEEYWTDKNVAESELEWHTITFPAITYTLLCFEEAKSE